jgi:hypothetical protein
MDSRRTNSAVTFAHPFRIAGCEGERPAGDHEVIVKEELLEGLGFEAYRRSGTFLLAHGALRSSERWRCGQSSRNLEAAPAGDQATYEQARCTGLITGLHSLGKCSHPRQLGAWPTDG